MKRFHSTLAIVVLAISAASAGRAATLTTINTNPFEPSIYYFLNAVYGAGNYERVSDDLDAIWTSQDIIGATAIGKTSNAKQRLGVCVLCDGSDNFLLGPAATQNGVTSALLFDETFVFGGPTFRWYDAPFGDPHVTTIYSDPLLNPHGVDQMVTFAIKNRPGVFVLGFEDRPKGILFHASDRDFNDFIVEVRFKTQQISVNDPPPNEEVPAVPEPSTVGLLGGALLALGFARRYQVGRA